LTLKCASRSHRLPLLVLISKVTRAPPQLSTSILLCQYIRISKSFIQPSPRVQSQVRACRWSLPWLSLPSPPLRSPASPSTSEEAETAYFRSIAIAKEKKASLRTGPELDIPGYGCLELFWKVIYFCTHGRCSQIFWQTQYARHTDRRGHGSQAPECSIQLSNIVHIRDDLFDSTQDVSSEQQSVSRDSTVSSPSNHSEVPGTIVDRGP
jgi:hypothetical protein